jgi:hypothetical protein
MNNNGRREADRRRETDTRVSMLYAAQSGRGWLNLVGKEWSDPTDMNNQTEVLQYIERLLAALEKNRSLLTVTIGYEFLEEWSKPQQKRLFYAIRNQPHLLKLTVTGLRSSPEVIDTGMILESLMHLQSSRIQKLMISKIELNYKSEVLLLATMLATRSASLQSISLKGLVSTVIGKEKGFLDPILLAMATPPEGGRVTRLSRFVLEGCDDITKHDPSLVTAEALRCYLAAHDIAATGRASRVLCLDGLGLGDEHAELIAGLAGESLIKLSLKSNPAIGKGYESLLWILNRNHSLEEICVVDSCWQAKIDLVIRMNRKYGRGAYMEDCAFTCKTKWVDFLVKLVDASLVENETEECRVNYLLYHLLEKPDVFAT